ncbi:MAG: hypothetical protein V1724_08480, partial [Chloroflexota bacterium]
MFNSRSMKIGVPVALLFAAAVAALALWAVMGGTSGIKDTLGYKGTIEWSVFDANGNLKASDIIHNSINKDPMETVVTNRLVTIGTTMADDTAVFARIVAIDVPEGGDVAGT